MVGLEQTAQSISSNGESRNILTCTLLNFFFFLNRKNILTCTLLNFFFFFYRKMGTITMLQARSTA